MVLLYGVFFFFYTKRRNRRSNDGLREAAAEGAIFFGSIPNKGLFIHTPRAR